jgi:hypothetical protein
LHAIASFRFILSFFDAILLLDRDWKPYRGPGRTDVMNIPDKKAILTMLHFVPQVDLFPKVIDEKKNPWRNSSRC